MRVLPTLTRCLCLSLCLTAVIPAAAHGAISSKALELEQLGFAELENERPERAEAAYRELVELLPKDPLGHANLAIALLRQQKYPEALAAVDRALELAPGRGDVLAIKGEILQWMGELESALAVLEEAAAASPDDVEILFALHQLATTLDGETAERAALRSASRLSRLRPENAVVLLQLGQRSIAAGNRVVATAVFKRIGELLWQEPELATRALGMVEEALKGDDLSAARVPAVRLENVLKVSPLYRESLRELKTGIQGVPLRGLEGEPEPTSFGDPIAVAFAGRAVDGKPTAGGALAHGDFDGDQRPDLARVRADGKLEVRLAKSGFGAAAELPAEGIETLVAADLTNDGHLDLLGFGPERGAVWLGGEKGVFKAAPEAMGLSGAGARAAAVIDFDIEGDLDLATAGARSGTADLYRNTLEGPLERVGSLAFPKLPALDSRAVAVSDLDRDGDLDLVFAHEKGFTLLDNLRQGKFKDRGAEAGPGSTSALTAVVAADLDQDGQPDLVGAGPEGLVAWHNQGRRFSEGLFKTWTLPGLDAGRDLLALVAGDFDNDGRLDLAAAGAAGVKVLTQTAAGGFETRQVEGGPGKATALTATDLDGDGDLDLVAAGPEGLHRLENRGGHRNHWLKVRLRGLDKGNSKNNVFGVGSVVEVRNGRAYQFREAAGDVVHLGLGDEPEAEILRVVWTNGVPQNRLDVERDQWIVEEQLLKGSCPFLYAWDGEGFSFVTDLLWGAPLGLPVAPGIFASSDPQELVKIEGLESRDGRWELRITEELWEAAFFDHVRLWVVDHPAGVEVASSLKIVPGESLPEAVFASRGLRSPARAWDGRGQDVTERIIHRDEVYADGYTPSPYQGVAETWAFTIDLGSAPARPVRLHLDGWIFPADASLNLAVSQRGDLPYLAPRLEVEVGGEWRVLLESMGHPAGKTKTMVVDTPPLPPGASKLRIVSSLWLHWDRIAWTTTLADSAAEVRARLLPASAELRYRGFSRLLRQAPNAPHVYDYAQVVEASPWLTFPGHYTRFGDVRELLLEADDRSVIMAPGDEMALVFDASELAPPAPGMHRTLFLESHGWDKDADRNTWRAQQVEPLPFRGMSGYPWMEGEEFPAELDEYREIWLTREVR